MEYMLVLQLSGSDPAEFDELVELEDAVREVIGDAGTVDGHDIGSGERNIFIFTEAPQVTFEAVSCVFRDRGLMNDLRAGYRVVGEDDFLPLYPSGLQIFAVI